MKKRGFTLIELLATTALAALLLIAGFKVIAAIGRTRASQAQAESLRSCVSEALDVVRWDLSNARYMKTSKSEMTLTGYCGLDAATLTPNHRPVTIRYHVAGAGGRNWLIREQTELDAATNRNKWSTLVFSGLAGFEVSLPPEEMQGKPNPTGVGDRVGLGSSTGAKARMTWADRTGWEGPEIGLDEPYDQVAVPSRLRVLIHPDGPDGASADKVIHTR